MCRRPGSACSPGRTRNCPTHPTWSGHPSPPASPSRPGWSGPSSRTVGIIVRFWPNGRRLEAESKPNDEIAGGVLSTVTVNGVENGLTSPETVPAVAVKRYWPSASVPGTANSSGARRRGLLADRRAVHVERHDRARGGRQLHRERAVLGDRVARAGEVAGDQLHVRRRQGARGLERERHRERRGRVAQAVRRLEREGVRAVGEAACRR